MKDTILLNGDYTVLGFISWRKAIKLVVKKKVEIIKESEKIIHNFSNTVKMVVPAIVRLLKVIRRLYGAKVPLSKKNILIRDQWTCAYCGKQDKKGMTVDHVTPKSKGGKSSFDNLVTACVSCNNKKDNKTCKESGMFLKFKPYTPTISEFITLQIKNTGIINTLKELGLA